MKRLMLPAAERAARFRNEQTLVLAARTRAAARTAHNRRALRIQLLVVVADREARTHDCLTSDSSSAKGHALSRLPFVIDGSAPWRTTFPSKGNRPVP